MDRRKFVKMASITAAGSLLPLKAMSQVVAGSSDGYKALVCLFMYGGNDSNNMLVPMDSVSYGVYSAARSGLALPIGTLLPLPGTNLGIHPSMPLTQSLYQAKSLAFVANMGTLVRPTTKAEIQANIASLPDNLMSHPDQRSCMETALKNSSCNPGWGGRIADIMGSAQTATVPMVISLYGNNCFIQGAESSGFIPAINVRETSAIASAEQDIDQLSSARALVAADEKIYAALSQQNNAYLSALQYASLPAVNFPSTGTASQLKAVASIISVRNQLEASRQIFFVGIQGFDTHGSQLDTHASLLAEVDGAIGAFAQTLQAMNLFNEVTLFTLSDFTRTMRMNSIAGSDHGWGGHHIVMGGAVQGGKVYGAMPSFEPGGPDDINGLGCWIPSTSVNQYAGTLASWFGVAKSDLSEILPDLQNFSSQNLGFV